MSRRNSSEEAPFAARFACSIRARECADLGKPTRVAARQSRLMRLRSTAFDATFLETMHAYLVSVSAFSDEIESVKNAPCTRRRPLRSKAAKSARFRRPVCFIATPKGALYLFCVAVSVHCVHSRCGFYAKNRVFAHVSAFSAERFVSCGHSKQ